MNENNIKEQYQGVTDAVLSEIAYAQSKWDEVRPDPVVSNSAPDPEKPLESWLVWAGEELAMARQKAYYSFDKKEAMHHVRKAAGHLFRAMLYIGVESRK